MLMNIIGNILGTTSTCILNSIRGVGRIFPRGGGRVLNVTFQKGSFCTDLLNKTLIKFDPLSSPPLPTPLNINIQKARTS